MIVTGETVGLAEWIIDDTCLVKTVIIAGLACCGSLKWYLIYKALLTSSQMHS